MIYIIFECDAHRSYSSYCIKEILTNKQHAIKHFNKGKKYYTDKGDGWLLNLATYIPIYNTSFDNDILRDMNVIKTTEE